MTKYIIYMRFDETRLWRREMSQLQWRGGFSRLKQSLLQTLTFVSEHILQIHPDNAGYILYI